MKHFWSSYIARRAAAAAVKPMVKCTTERYGDISTSNWRRPYVLGFVTMLISLIARERVGPEMSGERLGIVQMRVWSDITGSYDDMICEDVMLLSAADNEAFVRGCVNARHFHDVYSGRQEALPNAPIDFETLFASADDAHLSDTHIFGRGGAGAAALWARYFEDSVL